MCTDARDCFMIDITIDLTAKVHVRGVGIGAKGPVANFFFELARVTLVGQSGGAAAVERCVRCVPVEVWKGARKVVKPCM